MFILLLSLFSILNIVLFVGLYVESENNVIRTKENWKFERNNMQKKESKWPVFWFRDLILKGYKFFVLQIEAQILKQKEMKTGKKCKRKTKRDLFLDAQHSENGNLPYDGGVKTHL